MAASFEIRNTEMSDVTAVFKLFESSIRYQEKNGYPVWRDYDKGAIIRDIENKNQYKVIIGSETAIVFSVCYRDEIIWRDRDLGESIYLHRIVVNPTFKGQKLFALILNWAIEHTKQKRLQSIRMDTWASNSNLIAYYQSFGFLFVEEFTTPDSLELPIHNRNLSLALLEHPVKLP